MSRCEQEDEFVRGDDALGLRAGVDDEGARAEGEDGAVDSVEPDFKRVAFHVWKYIKYS